MTGAVLLGLTVLVLAWFALQRDWHTHDWGRRYTSLWVRPGWPLDMRIQISQTARCRDCGRSSVTVAGWCEASGWGQNR